MKMTKLEAMLLKACQAQVDEWHSTFRNMKRREPESLKLARAAIEEANNHDYEEASDDDNTEET